MADTDYPATLQALTRWSHEMRDLTHSLQTKYAEIKKAIDTGEGDPNGITLTPAQTAELEAEVVTMEAEVGALCAAHDVEPIEVEEEPEPPE